MDAILETIDQRGVASVTLNRPERHNALDGALVAQLTGALRRLDARADVRVVALGGAGLSFCAGGDIEWMKKMAEASLEENEADALALGELMRTLDALAKPTLAIVHGAAYGGGVGLVAASDFAIAAETATFCLSEVKLGIVPAIISPFVIRAIGARQARRYFVSAEVIFADRALAIGLVHETVPPEGLGEARERAIDALLFGAPGAQAEAKALTFLCEGRSVDASLLRENARRIALRRASPEGREGLNAFLEKRPPAWRVRTG